jgi:competence protein ComEC
MVDSKTKKLLLFISGLLVICIVLFLLVWQQESKNLEVIFFDIGQGDSIFIKTPSHHTILIDGGPDSSVLAKVGRALPFYDHTIDVMILTHAHSDHVVGLVDVLKRYEVGLVLYTDVDHTSSDFIEWRDLIEEDDINYKIAMAGQEYEFGQASLEILYPFEYVGDQEFKDLNDSSIIVRLEYQDTSFLLTGDASVVVEEELLNNYQDVELCSDVLKVGHHGSKYSSLLEFLQAVDPLLAVIQSGEGNKFGHPHRLVLKRLGGLGIEVLRNDEMGDIRMVSDGKEVRIE